MALSAAYEELAQGIAGTALSVAYDEASQGIPGVALGSAYEEAAQGIPGRSLSSGHEALAVDAEIAFGILRRGSGVTVTSEIEQFDEAANIAFVRRETAGPASAYDDAFTELINIGGGLSHTETRLGKAGERIIVSRDIVIEDDKISKAGDVLFAADLDLTLSARDNSVTLNESADTQLNTPFHTGAVLPLTQAINESLLKAAKTLARPFVNGAGLTLSLGTLVALDASGGVVEANATSNNAVSRPLGSANASILAAATGEVAYEGQVTVKFASGEGVGPHGGARVYLDTTAGFGTLVAPSASGNVRELIGTVINSSGYTDGSGGTMVVQRVTGQRKVIA